MLPDSGLPGEFALHMQAVTRGEKPFPTSSGTRHHFVPEFHLRRFRGRTERGKRLFVLDKSDGSVIESTPKEAGWRERLYSIDSVDGQHDGLVEGLFGLAENYASRPLTVLIKAAEPSITDGERANIAYLVAAQRNACRAHSTNYELRWSSVGARWRPSS